VEEGHTKVAVVGKNVYLRPLGLATQRNCLGIPAFLQAMFRVGCRHVVFDLSACQGMDSTFLGVVAHAATSLPRVPGKTVIILNAGQKACRQLKRIGLLPLLCLPHAPLSLPENLEFRDVDFLHFPKTENERLQKIKELHCNLAELNEKNRATFGSFIEMLEEELRREGANSQ
jgi:hypothetical protein